MESNLWSVGNRGRHPQARSAAVIYLVLVQAKAGGGGSERLVNVILQSGGCGAAPGLFLFRDIC